MKSLIAIDGSDCGDAVVDGGAAASNAIVLNECGEKPTASRQR